MRYLLIDTENLKVGSKSDTMYGNVLSEEETRAKFKEIWLDGHACGFCELDYSEKNKNEDWKYMEERL